MTVESLPHSIPRTAAEWFAARRAARNVELEQRFAQWIAQSPTNADEYALCEMTWELSSVAAEGLSAEAPARPWYRRGAVLGPVAVAASLALAAFTLLWNRQVDTLSWQTAPGEQRSITLADGSRVTLNTRSTLEARIGRSARDVRLLSGEAFFEVAADPKRPFIVETPLGKVSVLGTRFNVLLDDQRVEVSTEEGSVLVSSLDERSRNVVASPGMRATLTPDAADPTLGPADLGRIQNWRAHRLEFDEVPLSDALREFSRYSATPLRPASAQIGQIPVSAVLKTGDVEALRATLNAAFGLTLVAGQGEWVVTAGSAQPPAPKEDLSK